MIILITGAKGSGKSTIAGALADRINGIHLNESYLSQTINQDILYTNNSLEEARRAGELARMLSNIQEKPVVLDICLSSSQEWERLGPIDISVWMDTVADDSYEKPAHVSHTIESTGDSYLDSIPTRSFGIITKFNLFDWKPEQIVMAGHFQPWTREDLQTYQDLSGKGKVVIAIRHSGGMTPETPERFDVVKDSILNDIPTARIIKLPNIDLHGDKDE